MGCASIAERSVIPAVRSIPGWELAAVASRRSEKAERFASIFGCDAVVGYDVLLERDDIHAVYMPLPTGLHDQWVSKSLEAGKHVLVEKSMACDYDGAKRMADKAARAKLVLMENFMFQYHSQHRFVRELVEGGEIGEIRLFRSTFGFPPLAENNFRYNKDLGGGALLDAGGYPVKASQIFLGKGLKVEAANLSYDRERDVDIFGSAYLSSSSGMVSEIAFGFDNFYQCNYEFWGSKGKLIVERAFTPPPGFRPRIILDTPDVRKEFLAASDNHFVNILIEFHRAIVEKDYTEHLEAVSDQARILDEIRNRSLGIH
jgi:NDP-hexose-3-ketoreductase